MLLSQRWEEWMYTKRDNFADCLLDSILESFTPPRYSGQVSLLFNTNFEKIFSKKPFFFTN